MSKYIVRYGNMRLLGVFESSDEQQYHHGVKVIARTDRGLEAGEVLCAASEEAVERLKHPHSGEILRTMTADDDGKIASILDEQHERFATCRRCIDKLGLPMQLVDVEHIFGGERILVYYLADGRVDFRELVRMLAGEFQTRIEMRQIGVRDEAKLMADYGDCGNPVCCNNHLTQMLPVSMKMAKLQKATLDPTKISGRCGRLKCCLRYEYEVYEQIRKEMPRVGSRVTTPDGPAVVIGHEFLAGQLLVDTAEGVRKLIDLAEVSPLAPEQQPHSQETSKD